MKTGTCGLLLLLLSGVCHCQYEGGCSLNTSINDILFPDISSWAITAYQMAVDVTIPNLNMTDYYIDYYDKLEKKGRVDYFFHNDDTRKYYYYSDALESFEITERNLSCKEHNESSIPEFMGRGMYEWYYKEDSQKIHGPSAMFKLAYEEDRRYPGKVVYMGKSEDVRGIPAHYWRRCLQKNVTADYFFSSDSREGVYGLKDLTSIPLRIQIYGVDNYITEGSKSSLPHNYEIMTYTPFLEDPYYTFELPVGMGCGRKPREDDNKIPSFGEQSLYIGAEVVYTDYITGSPTTYMSNFVFSYDIDSEYLSYFYTPWTSADGEFAADYPVYVVLDSKNKYVYKTTYEDSRCVVGSVKQYLPMYSLPGGNKGYVSLSDPSVFYPNNEFYYLGEGLDRGYKVDIFEVAYPDGYPLGDRVVKNTVVTHYYLKAGKFKDGPRPVEKALTRIRMSFNGTDDDGKKMNSVLNFNLYTFSTGIDQIFSKFSIEQCARGASDIMFITVGFAADEAQLDLILEDLPSADENARSFLRNIIDIPPARMPRVMVELKEALYVTFVILERPPFSLDFDEPKANTYISGATETEGITLLSDCANRCLESEYDCWGFAHCGATCYIGAGERSKAKIEKKTDCQYFNRTNFRIVPRLKTIKRDLERAVEKRQPHLSVDKKGGGEIIFTPTYIQDAIMTESAGIFERMGMETDSRLRVVKVGRKLTTDSGENVGRNFGSLTYGECQRLCLDFKACETVSFCLSSGECILSLTHAEDIQDSKFVEDSFCNVLTRRYSDAFTRSPGDVLSQSATKLLDAVNEEDCAKACLKETSFNCLSFDNCRTTDGKEGCRLHDVHTLDLQNKEGAVSKQSICGHYSKKFTYDFKRQLKKKSAGSGIMMSTGVTVEQCAKYCLEYNQGQCNGFDSCQTADLGSTCIILTENVSEMKTTTSDMCDHFERANPVVTSGRTFSTGLAGGVGFLLFVIGCVLGALIVYGIAYRRANRPL